MTFFDKLFTSKNKIFKSAPNSGSQCFKPSDRCQRLELAAEQVQVLVYRECEKRGRKLLFDSDSVEKLPAESVCRVRRPSDIVEINSCHAYKYKKPCNEVTKLGEMVFGSVAMSFRSGAVSKIHNIPSPKRLLFTTVIPTTLRCQPGARRASGSGDTSCSESRTSGCSSDSKLYHCTRKLGAPFPNNCPVVLSACRGSMRSTTIHSGLHRSPNVTSLKCLGTDMPDGCEDRLTSKCSFAGEPPSLCSRLFPESYDGSMTCEDGMLLPCSSPPLCSRRPSDGRSYTAGSFGSAQSLNGSFGSQCDSRSSSMSRNCSGGSLSSLRRRWHNSHGTSLELSFCEDGDESAVRVRTKLGIALVLSLPDSQQTEIESFLLNHSSAMEQILDKLRCLVEDAYSHCDEFVHLTYSAFLTTRASVVDLVKSRQYLAPRWLHGATARADAESVTTKNFNKFRRTVCGKEKFVAEFCEILRVYEVKDTNFFVSTLLTAVLTHNLSWVPSIVDKSLSHEERRNLTNEKKTVYNPLNAQIGDVSGMLGSPLKSTKVVLAGGEKEVCTLTSMLNILSYFIRCNNIVENAYAPEFSLITSMCNEKPQEENFDSGVDCDMRETVTAAKETPMVTRCFDSLLRSSCATTARPQIAAATMKTEPLYPNLGGLKLENGLRTECSNSKVGLHKGISVPVCETSECFVDKLKGGDCGLGNFVAMLRKSDTTRDCCNSLQSTCGKSQRSLYPDIEELARQEHVRLEDLSSAQDRTMFVEDVLLKEASVEKPSSPDEGYATLHAGSALGKEKCVMFEVGGGKEPITLVTKASTIRLESENVRDSLSRRRKRQDRYHTINIPVRFGAQILQQRSRTMENVSQECQPDDLGVSLADDDDDEKETAASSVDEFKELPLPCCRGPLTSLRLPVCSFFGDVSSCFNPYQVLQAVTEPSDVVEQEVRKDLSRTIRTKIVSEELTEAVCVIGDLSSWYACAPNRCVDLHSTKRTSMGPKKGLTVASSQMVADMLESLSRMHCIGMSPEFCLQHIEKKLEEIYEKSKAVAELLMTTDFCNLELLTRCLDISVNDVPLLLSVATTHTPELADRYGITFS